MRLVEVPASGQEAASLRLDMRSASRLGKGDMGANANRIQTYITALSTRLGV